MNLFILLLMNIFYSLYCLICLKEIDKLKKRIEELERQNDMLTDYLNTHTYFVDL